jgi:hypothetical protein
VLLYAMAQFGKTATPLSERIKNSITVDENGCWVWNKHITANGYSQISTGSRVTHSLQNRSGHRVSYEVFVGPLIEGMQIDHLCRNRACVNPDHLEQVTPRENIHRSDAVYKRLMAKTHCPKGHLYDEKNTYRSKSPSGGFTRSCITCRINRVKNKYRLLHPDVKEGMPLWAQNAAKTHCPKGHEYSTENTYLHNGGRHCKECGKENQKRRLAIKRLERVQ